MEHWFDSFVKKAAQSDSSVTRRGMIAGLAGLAAIGSSRALALGSPDSEAMAAERWRARLAELRRFPQQPQQPYQPPQAAPQQIRRGACTHHHAARSHAADFSVTHEDLSLQINKTIDHATRQMMTRVSLTKASAPILNMTTRTPFTITRQGETLGESRIEMTFSPAVVQGVRSATFRSLDHRTVQGTIENRPVAPFQAAQPHDERSIRFQDNRPAPSVQMAPQVRQQVQGLVAKVAEQIASCRTPQRRGERGGDIRLAQLPGRPGVDPLLGKSDTDPPIKVSVDGVACNECKQACAEGALECHALALAGSWFPPVLAAAWVTCIGRAGVCSLRCHLPDHACCPVWCSADAGSTDYCCGHSETCFQASAYNPPPEGHCCPPGRVVCRNECCAANISSCAPNGVCGCPQGITLCGNVCCPPGQTCCGGRCCRPDFCQNGVCRDVPRGALCGGQTCGPFDNCCGGRCCTGTCVNNQCCPPGRGCGSACCAPGQNCIDPARSVCQAPTLRCRGVGVRPCRTQLANGSYTEICCRGGVECCAGKCCPTGQQCCFNSRNIESGCCFSGGVR